LRVEGGREREEGEADGEREDAMADLASQRNEQYKSKALLALVLDVRIKSILFLSLLLSACLGEGEAEGEGARSGKVTGPAGLASKQNED